MQRTDYWISLAFVFLIVSEGLLMAYYWQAVLRPRLHQEANSQVAILVQAQAARLSGVLSNSASCCVELMETMDEILTFSDPETKAPFFPRIALELDDEAVTGHFDSSSLARGVDGCPDCFLTEAPMFDETSYELLGAAKFWVSDRFFRQLSGDVRENLTVQAGAGIVLLVVAWASVLTLVHRLRRQTGQRQRAERALWQNQQRYQRLLGNLPNYFVYAREPGRDFFFVSDSVEKVLGYSPQEVKKNFRDYLADDPLNRILIERMTGSAPADQPYEIVIRGADGKVRHIECAETSLVDARSPVQVVEGIARDITEQRSFEGALKLAKERAEAASEAKSQFLANVSHEIRTPMNAIIGLTALALKADPAPRQQDYLAKIDYSAHALLEIIDDILDISKVEAGSMELEAIEFELDDVLRRLTDNVALKAEEKGIEVAFSVAPNVPHKLVGDTLRLGQVLLNLTNNAIKFTHKGEVLVGIRLIEESGHLIRLEFSVRDTGIGIEPEKISQLFEPFTQADGSNTRVYGGTGLGLAISKRLVELMNGSIHADSVLGHGSIFWFTAEFAKNEHAASNPWELPDALRGLRVLVVDDNLMARETFRNALTVLSFDVEVADTGVAAVHALAKAQETGHPVRLVLLDWVMPELDGIETARRIRSDVRIREQPTILLVSAYSRELPLQLVRDVDVGGILAKPVSQSELFDAVVSALGHDGAGKALGDRLRHPRRQVPSFTPGTRLLVVEDNAINQQVAEELLANAGFDVSIAGDGAQALAILDRECFAAVLMDLQMPVMDGFAATRRLRVQARFADLPVIAMTAHAMTGDVERCLGAGMNDYVSKPVDADRLLRVLSRWIPHAHSKSSGEAEGLPLVSDPAWPGIEFRAALRNASGNRGLVERLIRQFIDGNAETMGRIETALQRGEMGRAATLVHTLKGEAGAVGAQDVVRAAMELEQVARNGSAWEQSLKQLHQDLDRVLRGRNGDDATEGATWVSGTESGSIDVEDLARVLPLLNQLAGYLQDNNMAARDCFHKLHAMDEMRDLGGELAEINRAMERLDYEQALRRTHALAQDLNVELRP